MKQSMQISRALFLALLSSASFMNAKIVHLSSHDEFQQLLNNKEVAVVKFSAEWCGACKSIKDAFDSVAKDPEFSHITFAYVDADKNGELLHRQGVTGLPTFVYLENGDIKRKEAGVSNPATFAQELKNELRSFKVAQASVMANVDTKGKVVTEETTVNPITGTETTTKEETKEKTKGGESEVKQNTTTTTQPVSTEHMSLVDKIHAFFVWFFVSLKNALMGIVNWVKGLFGK